MLRLVWEGNHIAPLRDILNFCALIDLMDDLQSMFHQAHRGFVTEELSLRLGKTK